MSELKEITSIAADIAVITGVLAAFCSVFVAFWAMCKDHERRKNQAFIEFYQRMQRSWRQQREILAQEHNNEGAIDEKSTKYDTFLQEMEVLAVAINMDIYDIDVLIRCTGRALVRCYKRLKPVIEYKREKNKNIRLYKDFKELVEEINKRRPAP